PPRYTQANEGRSLTTASRGTQQGSLSDERHHSVLHGHHRPAAAVPGPAAPSVEAAPAIQPHRHGLAARRAQRLGRRLPAPLGRADAGPRGLGAVAPLPDQDQRATRARRAEHTRRVLNTPLLTS